jgi:predicted nucleic-acid-binding Zn-ribbon protein
MKKTRKCPKCNSTEIIANAKSFGPGISARLSIKKLEASKPK